MLSRVLKMAFWVTYDHLGKLILANLAWSLVLVAPVVFGAVALKTGDPGIVLVIGVPMFILAFGVLLPVMSAGLAHMVKQLIDTRDGSLRDLFEGMRLYWKPSVGVGFFFIVAATCLPVSVWFYAAKLRAAAPLAGYAISALALWCLAFVGLMALLVMPALVQKKAGLADTLKLTAVLVVDNPVFCIGLAIQMLGLVAISLVFSPLIFFLSGSVAVVLVSSAYEMLARKYAAQRANAGGGEGHIRAMGRGEGVMFDDDQDDYLNRGFRDFLFPWKG